MGGRSRAEEVGWDRGGKMRVEGRDEGHSAAPEFVVARGYFPFTPPRLPCLRPSTHAGNGGLF